jgi:hypothetical protein
MYILECLSFHFLIYFFHVINPYYWNAVKLGKDIHATVFTSDVLRLVVNPVLLLDEYSTIFS